MKITERRLRKLIQETLTEDISDSGSLVDTSRKLVNASIESFTTKYAHIEPETYGYIVDDVTNQLTSTGFGYHESRAVTRAIVMNIVEPGSSDLDIAQEIGRKSDLAKRQQDDDRSRRTEENPFVDPNNRKHATNYLMFLRDQKMGEHVPPLGQRYLKKFRKKIESWGLDPDNEEQINSMMQQALLGEAVKIMLSEVTLDTSPA